MATAGRETQGASVRGVENRAYGRAFSMNNGDALTEVRAWLAVGTGAHTMQAFVYDTSGNRLATSTPQSVSAGTAQVAFSISYTFTSTATYVIGIISQNDTGSNEAYYDAGSATSYYDADASNSYPAAATWVGIGTDNNTDDSSIAITYTEAGGSSVTKTPTQAVLTVNVLAPLTNAYTFVAIQDTLVNESGQVVANAANIRLLVWYNGEAIGAPDYSVNGQTSNASGSISWSVTPGSLANGQAIFYLAQDSISYSNYTCGRVVPTYG